MFLGPVLALNTSSVTACISLTTVNVFGILCSKTNLQHPFQIAQQVSMQTSHAADVVAKPCKLVLCPEKIHADVVPASALATSKFST